jgi:hypothetical protein
VDEQWSNERAGFDIGGGSTMVGGECSVAVACASAQ